MRLYSSLLLLYLFLTAFKPADRLVERGFAVTVDSVKSLFVEVLDEDRFPLYYYTDIDRFPCNDSVCERMQLRMYWDSWGNYLKFSFKEGQELTKINHVPFTEKDYKRLHKLLNNPNAFIQHYKLDDLTEHQSEMRYYSVDAVTSATVSDVNIVYESVKGAVKTCYTLWKIVNNKSLKEELKANTIKRYKQSDNQSGLHSEVVKALIEYRIMSSEIATQVHEKVHASANFKLKSAYFEYARFVNFSPSKSFWDNLETGLDKGGFDALINYNLLLKADINDKKVRNFNLEQHYSLP